MARTRRMTANARSTTTKSSPPPPPLAPIAGQYRGIALKQLHAQASMPVPSATGGSPSMMERLFPSGLPHRYTRHPAAVPPSIGSVISSSQESSRSPSPVLGVSATLRASPRHGTRPPSASSDKPRPHGTPHGPDATAEDRIASFLGHSPPSNRACSSLRTPQPSTLALPEPAPDPIQDEGTLDHSPPSETDEDATITDVQTTREASKVPVRSDTFSTHCPSFNAGTAVAGGSSPLGNLQAPDHSLEDPWTAARHSIPGSPLSDVHESVSVPDNFPSPDLGWAPEPASSTAPGTENGGLEVPSSVSSPGAVSPSSPSVPGLTSETPGTSPFEDQAEDLHKGEPSTPSSSPASLDGLPIIIELGSEYNSPESPPTPKRRSAQPNDASSSPSPRPPHKCKRKTSKLNVPPSSPSPRPSRKREAAEATHKVRSGKRPRLGRAAGASTASTTKTPAKKGATRGSKGTPAKEASAATPTPPKPTAKQDVTRKSARKPATAMATSTWTRSKKIEKREVARRGTRKPARADPVRIPMNRVTKASRGKSKSDGPYGLRSRETRKVTAKVAMNLGLDVEDRKR